MCGVTGGACRGLNVQTRKAVLRSYSVTNAGDLGTWFFSHEGVPCGSPRSAEMQRASPLACVADVLPVCLGARTAFISGQCECDADDGVFTVPAEAGKVWIRGSTGVFSTAAQLQALDCATTIKFLKVSEIQFLRMNQL